MYFGIIFQNIAAYTASIEIIRTPRTRNSKVFRLKDQRKGRVAELTLVNSAILIYSQRKEQVVKNVKLSA